MSLVVIHNGLEMSLLDSCVSLHMAHTASTALSLACPQIYSQEYTRGEL